MVNDETISTTKNFKEKKSEIKTVWFSVELRSKVPSPHAQMV